ncbi:Appr-1-p processing enzyme family protein isoform 1 [Melia azedarach]|uniref:Appr-1-p processing enzyme family protein isoform 1 n=1 Tax=Melia azedarach TaxID=155640 RepID=A0ACC1Y2P3_MELAZ|nr:Appr-1-p processing enzyme family protein isoform 1 [Melia azedarach]
MTFKVTTVLFSGSNGVDDGRSNSALKIKKGDITQWFVDGSSDAIVNSANKGLLGGGGADGAIHRAAGLELGEACYRVPEVGPGIRCPTGEARITPGFKLPASRVIHTVGPNYGVDNNPEAALRNAYKNSLSLAKVNNIQYIAFPAISCGLYGYPHEEAATIAISTVKEYAYDFKEVHFVLFTDDIYSVWLKTAKRLLEE